MVQILCKWHISTLYSVCWLKHEQIRFGQVYSWDLLLNVSSRANCSFFWQISSPRWVLAILSTVILVKLYLCAIWYEHKIVLVMSFTICSMWTALLAGAINILLCWLTPKCYIFQKVKEREEYFTVTRIWAIFIASHKRQLLPIHIWSRKRIFRTGSKWQL